MTKHIILAPKEGRSLFVLGEQITCKVVGKETSDRWSLFEVQVPPGAGPPPHLHMDFDEAYYLLEGELDLQVGADKIIAVLGSFVTIPRGTMHTYKNNSTYPAKFLAWASPSGIELFFEELDREIRSFPPDLEKVLSIAAKHHVEIVPPHSV